MQNEPPKPPQPQQPQPQAQPSPKPTGYGITYDIRAVAAWAQTPEGEKYRQELAGWKRENLVGRPGIDYDVRDIAMAAKLHPEWFVVSGPQAPQQRPAGPTMLPGGIRHLIERQQQMEWEAEVNLAYARKGWTPEAASKLYEAYQAAQPQNPLQKLVYDIGETINPQHKPLDVRKGFEDIGSSLVLRSFWDPAYNKRMMAEAKADAAFYSTPEGQLIKQRQTELFSTAVGLGLMAYTAYDVGRNLYNIVKYRDLIREPIVTLEGSPEIPEEKFQVISMSGPKGERASDLMNIVPKAAPVQDTFAISPTRGRWSGKPIMEDTKASTTLTDLFMIRPVASLPTLISYGVPFGSYEPFLTTEMFAAGIAFGQVLPKDTMSAGLKVPKVDIGKITRSDLPRFETTMPARLVTVTKPTVTPKPQTPLIERSGLIDFTIPDAYQDQWQGLPTLQRQGAGQTQIQIQRSALKSLEEAKYDFRMPTEFMRKIPRRKGKDLFGFHDWSRSFYPIKRAKEFLKGV